MFSSAFLQASIFSDLRHTKRTLKGAMCKTPTYQKHLAGFYINPIAQSPRSKKLTLHLSKNLGTQQVFCVSTQLLTEQDMEGASRSTQPVGSKPKATARALRSWRGTVGSLEGVHMDYIGMTIDKCKVFSPSSSHCRHRCTTKLFFLCYVFKRGQLKGHGAPSETAPPSPQGRDLAVGWSRYRLLPVKIHVL